MSFLYKKVTKDNEKRTFVLGMLFAYKKRTKDGYIDRRLFGLWKAEKKQYVTNYYIRGIRVWKKTDQLQIIQDMYNDKFSELSRKFSLIERQALKKQYDFPELLDNLCCISGKDPTDKIFIDENINPELHKELVQRFYPEYNPDEFIELATKRFIFNHDKYLKNRLPSAPKKRLFIVSGTLSLTNALCYIKENENSDQYEDSIVVCGAYFSRFIEDTLQIINLHDFKKILFCKASENVKNVLLFNNLYQVDELIHIAYTPVLNAITDLFLSEIKRVIILEYMPVIPFGMIANEKKTSYVFCCKHFDKIDYAYPEKNFPVHYMKKETFSSIIAQIQKELNLNLLLDRNQKNILICGGSLIPREENLINFKQLQEKGYEVYFKPHPRDHEDYSSFNVHLIKTSFSVEYYDLSNFVAVLSYASQMMFTLTDLNIPVFRITPKVNIYSQHNFLQRLTVLTQEYIQPWELLLEADLSKSPEELREEFLKKQKEFLQTKPKLSENEHFKKTISLLITEKNYANNSFAYRSW